MLYITDIDYKIHSLFLPFSYYMKMEKNQRGIFFFIYICLQAISLSWIMMKKDSEVRNIDEKF